jgi:hypothetical protein
MFQLIEDIYYIRLLLFKRNNKYVNILNLFIILLFIVNFILISKEFILGYPIKI